MDEGKENPQPAVRPFRIDDSLDPDIRRDLARPARRRIAKRSIAQSFRQGALAALAAVGIGAGPVVPAPTDAAKTAVVDTFDRVAQRARAAEPIDIIMDQAKKQHDSARKKEAEIPQQLGGGSAEPVPTLPPRVIPTPQADVAPHTDTSTRQPLTQEPLTKPSKSALKIDVKEV